MQHVVKGDLAGPDTDTYLVVHNQYPGIKVATGFVWCLRGWLAIKCASYHRPCKHLLLRWHAVLISSRNDGTSGLISEIGSQIFMRATWCGWILSSMSREHITAELIGGGALVRLVQVLPSSLSKKGLSKIVSLLSWSFFLDKVYWNHTRGMVDFLLIVGVLGRSRYRAYTWHLLSFQNSRGVNVQYWADPEILHAILRDSFATNLLQPKYLHMVNCYANVWSCLEKKIESTSRSTMKAYALDRSAERPVNSSGCMADLHIIQ